MKRFSDKTVDLDSLCSALLLAYFYTYAPSKRRASIGDGSLGSNALHIPICHLLRADLALRPEFTAVLRDAGVRGEDVFTLEDVLPQSNDQSQSKTAKGPSHSASSSDANTNRISPEDTRWLLVDHNAMTGSLANTFRSRVVGCVDHHADENAVPRDAEPRIIEKSGSCASLVLEHCAEIWDALGTHSGTIDGVVGEREGEEERGEDAKEIDAQIARLALAPILIDTTSLGDKNKTTVHDERAVKLAEAKIAEAEKRLGKEEAGERYSRDAFFKRLAELKEDIADMSFRDVFRKDYKEWSVAGLNLGTSSVPRGFGYLVDQKAKGDKAGLLKALMDWGAEKDELAQEGSSMDVVMLLTAFQDEQGKFRRELLVWGRSEKGVRAAKLFEEKHASELRLESWGDGVLDENDGGKNDWRRCWVQRAVEHSRKQIAPMLRDALKEVAG